MNTRMIVSRYGGEEVLKAVEEPLRRPMSGEVRVRMLCAGVALADIMRREGKYPMSPVPPFTPGYEVVGIVDEVGEDVKQYEKGDRVGVFFNGTGGYAAYVYADENEAFKVPESVDPAKAAAVILNYVTAYQMLHRLAGVKSGESVLIHGAGGGVGTALLELGKLANLRLFGTASAAKHPVVSGFGAVPIDYRKDDFVQELKRLAPDGIDAVFDPIGGANWSRSFRTLSAAGRFVGYGYTSVLSETGTDDWIQDWKRLSETKRTEAGHPAYLYSITNLKQERPDWFREDVQIVFSLLERGAVEPLVAHRIPLREAAYAQQLLEHSSVVGKVVLTGSD